MSRHNLAEHIGFDVSAATIKRYEDGHGIPPFDTAIRLAMALDVPIESLMEGDDAEG